MVCAEAGGSTSQAVNNHLKTSTRHYFIFLKEKSKHGVCSTLSSRHSCLMITLVVYLLSVSDFDEEFFFLDSIPVRDEKTLP